MRSLSTLIAVNVNKDTEHNIYPVMNVAIDVKRQISHRSFAIDIHLGTLRGCSVIPYQHKDQLSPGYKTRDWTADEGKTPCEVRLGSEY